MLIELCGGNYATHDGLVNGVDDLFKTSILMNSRTYIFIQFLNIKIGSLTRLVNTYLYQDKSIDPTWTSIEHQTKEIQIGTNETHLITRIQFPIQLATAQTIHRSQGLSLDEMAFDPSGINKHGLVYIALSKIRTKKIVFTKSTSDFELPN